MYCVFCTRSAVGAGRERHPHFHATKAASAYQTPHRLGHAVCWPTATLGEVSERCVGARARPQRQTLETPLRVGRSVGRLGPAIELDRRRIRMKCYRASKSLRREKKNKTPVCILRPAGRCRMSPRSSEPESGGGGREKNGDAARAVNPTKCSFAELTAGLCSGSAASNSKFLLTTCSFQFQMPSQTFNLVRNTSTAFKCRVVSSPTLGLTLTRPRRLKSDVARRRHSFWESWIPDSASELRLAHIPPRVQPHQKTLAPLRFLELGPFPDPAVE